MGVGLELINAHIAEWESRLEFGSSFRKHWPSRLFRHEPLESAVAVLRSGRILSRAAAAGQIQRDIAPAEIISTTDAAHNYVRLYFRPRTPTQFRIEGVRKPADLYGGRHAPVLYMFVFSSRRTLTRDDVHFSNGNMQSAATLELDGDEGFKKLDFSKIYHYGSYSKSDPDSHDIVRWRCAEVLLPSPLELDQSLQAVICRSHAERRTLLHALGPDAARWADRIKIFNEAGMFCGEYAYVESVDASSEAFTVQFHPRRDAQPVAVHVELRRDGENDVVKWWRQDLDIRSVWRFLGPFEDGMYRADIYLDGELAYRAVSEVDALPF